jgi:hypothetical protein
VGAMAIQATLTTTIPVPMGRMSGGIFDVAFRPDGRWLALATDGKQVPLVEIAAGRTRLGVRHGFWLKRGCWGGIQL